MRYKVTKIIIFAPYPTAEHVDMLSEQSWALQVFISFFKDKNVFYCIFYKVNNLFLHQSYLKSVLQVKLTWQNAKNHFFNWKNI